MTNSLQMTAWSSRKGHFGLLNLFGLSFHFWVPWLQTSESSTTFLICLVQISLVLLSFTADSQIAETINSKIAMKHCQSTPTNIPSVQPFSGTLLAAPEELRVQQTTKMASPRQSMCWLYTKVIGNLFSFFFLAYHYQAEEICLQ